MRADELAQIGHISREPLAVFRDPVQNIVEEIPGNVEPDQRVGYQQLGERTDSRSSRNEIGETERPVVLALPRRQEVVEADSVDNKLRLYLRDEALRDAQDVFALRSVDARVDDFDPPVTAEQPLELTRISESLLDPFAVGQAVAEDEHPEDVRIFRGRRTQHPEPVGIVDMQHPVPVSGAVGARYLYVAPKPVGRHYDGVGPAPCGSDNTGPQDRIRLGSGRDAHGDRKSTRLNSSHVEISYAVFCLKKKKTKRTTLSHQTKKKNTKQKPQ